MNDRPGLEWGRKIRHLAVDEDLDVLAQHRSRVAQAIPQPRPLLIEATDEGVDRVRLDG